MKFPSFCVSDLARATAALLIIGSATGCADIGVKPWQRDLMARPAMQLDANPNETAIDEHVYFSKEASSGGRGLGGGGCGCN